MHRHGRAAALRLASAQLLMKSAHSSLSSLGLGRSLIHVGNVSFAHISKASCSAKSDLLEWPLRKLDWVSPGCLAKVVVDPLHEPQPSGLGLAFPDGACSCLPSPILMTTKHWELNSYQALPCWNWSQCPGRVMAHPRPARRPSGELKLTFPRSLWAACKAAPQLVEGNLSTAWRLHMTAGISCGIFFFPEYGRRVGMVPRSSLKEGKYSQMVEKRTRTTQQKPNKQKTKANHSPKAESPPSCSISSVLG